MFLRGCIDPLYLQSAVYKRAFLVLCGAFDRLKYIYIFPANTERCNNVVSMLMQRLDVESTLKHRCFNVVCLLNWWIFVCLSNVTTV